MMCDGCTESVEQIVYEAVDAPSLQVFEVRLAPGALSSLLPAGVLNLDDL